MDQEKVASLIEIAIEFGDIAEQVSTSAVLRRNHTVEAVKYIDLTIELGEILKKEISVVAKSNLEQRNRDTSISNTCIILKSNIEKQKDIITDLLNKNLIDSEISSTLLDSISEFEKALDEATEHIAKMIQADNEIILMDNQLIMSKNKQMDYIRKLKSRTLKSQEEAEKAIEGSASNLKRGQKLAEEYQNIEELLRERDRDDLNRLLVEANIGWNLAIDVNKNSISQLEYAEMVYEFTKELHKDSLIIKDLVHRKHKLFEKNLQVVTVLTVILSVKFKQFLVIDELFSKIQKNEENREIINDLEVLVDIICKDIRELMSINLDMTESSHVNNETETRTLDLTNKEIDYFVKLKEEVVFITEATRFSIKGSHKNISNGQLLEKYLKELMEQI